MGLRIILCVYGYDALVCTLLFHSHFSSSQFDFCQSVHILFYQVGMPSPSPKNLSLSLSLSLFGQRWYRACAHTVGGERWAALSSPLTWIWLYYKMHVCVRGLQYVLNRWYVHNKLSFIYILCIKIVLSVVSTFLLRGKRPTIF